MTKNTSKKICVIGSGYVGLVTGACLAEKGHQVICVDKDQTKIDRLKKGEIPIYEPGLGELVTKNTEKKQLSFVNDLGKAVGGAEAVFIAVGTPSSRRGDGYADLSFVYQVAKELAPHLKEYKVVVDKSTVPVGTADEVRRVIKETNPEADFDVASNPEFLREGEAIDDFLRPDRVVLGVDSERAEEVLRGVYKPLADDGAFLLVTGIKTAELIKYASNAFLATKISFINEMANLCEKLDADVLDLARGMGMDKRIGSAFLKTGPGYGGSCFPKDVTALLRVAQENETSLRILESVSEVNIAQKARMVKKIKRALGGEISGKTVLFLGLTFKANTDDMRDASSLTIIPALTEKGTRVLAHDPQGTEEAKKILPPEVEYLEDFELIYKKAEEADVLVLLTDWAEYGGLDWEKLAEGKPNRTVVDLRNFLNPETVRRAGFNYVGLGRQAGLGR